MPVLERAAQNASRHSAGHVRAVLYKAALAVWGLFLFLAAASGAYGQNLADFRASAEAGYGRMEIEFRDLALLPEYDVTSENGILKLTFSDPVKTRVDNAPRLLADYISVARAGGDGRTLRFALKDDFLVNTIDAGNRLFVDLLPRDWAGAPPGLPDAVIQELARRAEEVLRRARKLEQARLRGQPPPQVNLRIGYHPTFSRLTFDWSVPFDSAFVREGDLVRVTFDHGVSIDLSKLKSNLPPGIVDATAFIDADRLKFLLRIDPQAAVRAFREDNTYVLDVTPARLPEDRESDMQADASVTPESPDTMAQRPDLSIAGPGAAPASPDARDIVTSLSDAPAARPGNGAPGRAAPSRLSGNTESGQAGAPQDTGGVNRLQPASPPGTQRAPAPQERRSVSPETIPADPGEAAGDFIIAEATRTGDTVRVDFTFPQPVAAAIFRAHGGLWLIFDSKIPIDIRALRAVLGLSARTVNHESMGEWQKIHIVFARDILTSVMADETSWIVSMGTKVAAPVRPVNIGRSLREDGSAHLRLGFADAGGVRSFFNDISGDRLIAVTGFGPARGVLRAQKFVDFDLLQSDQGIAVSAHADDLYARPGDGALFLERPGGLHLSRNGVPPGTSPHDDSDGFDVPVDALRTRDADDPDVFITRRQQLYRQIDAGEGAGRTAARLELASLFLAHDFAQEALGMMKRAAGEAPTLVNTPRFNLLYGAAHQLAGQSHKALDYLDHKSLAGSADAALWRVMANADNKSWAAARPSIPLARAAAGNYTSTISNEFMLAAATIMVRTGNPGAALELLGRIEPDTLSHEQATRRDLLGGQIADAAGQTRQAERAWERVARSGLAPFVAKARLLGARARYQSGDQTRKETIAELERLSAGWRGDETELETLRFLADLHVRAGNYSRAFQILEQAMLSDVDAPVTRMLQDEMSAIFTDLFIGERAGELDALGALALYYDFRELTPVDHRGDEIVRRLAGQLISIDLLDAATDLVRHQTDNRLKGAARARAGADLAVIYLIDGAPQSALEVIARTRQAQLPRTLENQRTIVEARTLNELGRTELALALIRNMSGKDVDRLRADVLWKAQNWQEAGTYLEEMLGGRWRDGLALNPGERADVLRAALAYALAGDPFGTRRINRKFAAKMGDSEDAGAFAIATQPFDGTDIRFLALARQLSQENTLDMFLQDYQERYFAPVRTAPDHRAPVPQDRRVSLPAPAIS